MAGYRATGKYGPTIAAAKAYNKPSNTAKRPNFTGLGYATSAFDGSISTAARAYSYRGMVNAAKTLTAGNAGNFKDAGKYGSRANYANYLTRRTGLFSANNQFKNAQSALEQHNKIYGSNAKSTQQLTKAATTASRWNNFASKLKYIDPAIHGIQAYQSSNAKKPWNERWAAGITGALKRADNVALSWGSGTLVAGVGSAGTGGIGTVGAVAAGVTTGVAVGNAYEKTSFDKFLDRQIGKAEPKIAAGLKYTGIAANYTAKKASSAYNSVKNYTSSFFNKPKPVTRNVVRSSSISLNASRPIAVPKTTSRWSSTFNRASKWFGGGK